MPETPEQESKEARARSVERQMEGDEPPVTPPPNPSSDAAPAPGTDDVGESVTRRGEDVADKDGKEPGREDDESESPTGRPAGTSSGRDSTGVDPDDPVTGSPPMGGQGG